MGHNYKTKTIVFQHNNETMERVIKHDLDKAYLTDRSGDIKVYRNANIIIDGKHLFVLSHSDYVVAKANKLRKGFHVK